jgi:hypothetical protein
VGIRSRWPRGTLYPLKLVLTSPTSDDRSVGIVYLRTKAPEFFVCLFTVHISPCYLAQPFWRERPVELVDWTDRIVNALWVVSKNLFAVLHLPLLRTMQLQPLPHFSSCGYVVTGATASAETRVLLWVSACDVRGLPPEDAMWSNERARTFLPTQQRPRGRRQVIRTRNFPHGEAGTYCNGAVWDCDNTALRQSAACTGCMQYSFCRYLVRSTSVSFTKEII